MSRTLHTLNAKQVNDAKPGSKAGKLFDGGGLYLEVTPEGRKWWRCKYRYQGREKRISLGYPSVSLKQARARRQTSREQLDANIDPNAARKATMRRQ